jgi:hypothetical protein
MCKRKATGSACLCLRHSSPELPKACVKTTIASWKALAQPIEASNDAGRDACHPITKSLQGPVFQVDFLASPSRARSNAASRAIVCGQTSNPYL